MLRSHSIGVLFVHGIGRQRRGETLIRFGEPLAREVHERFSPGAPTEMLVPERPGVIQLGAASLDDPDTPPHVEIKLRNIQSFRAKPSANPDTDWLFAEAWWADVFPTPPLQEIVRWSFDIVPWTLIAHFDTRVRRAWFRLRQAATWEEQARAIVGAAWESLVLMFVSLVGIPLLFVLLVTILMVAALPISYARNVAAWLQRVIAATIGDSYVLVGWPIAAAAIVERVARDFAWLQERCQRVIIVAHSQGAAITHEFLRNAPLTPCDAFVTFGSGLRKLSEIRDAVDSKGQGWLRLLVAAGLVGDGLFITLITNFAVPGLWPWLLLGIALMVVASRVAVVMWRKANERSTSVEEQWITDRKQYDRRYRLPARFHWIDCFASADPVPNGPLLDSFEPVEIRTRCFENYHSVLGDHNAYWRNKDDFVAQLGSELMRQAGIDSKRVDPDDVERQYVATARRQFRVLWLRASRWVVLLASLVAISAWWSTAPAWFGGAVAAIAGALGRIPWVGSALAQHGGTGLGHPPGILLTAIAAAAWIVLLRLIWNWWNARDIQRRYRREEYPIPIADYRWGLFVALLVAGFVLVLWATWLTGDARPAMVVTIGVAGLFALVAVKRSDNVALAFLKCTLEPSTVGIAFSMPFEKYSIARAGAWCSK